MRFLLIFKMSIFKILLVLFSSIFIQISKTEKLHPENTNLGRELDNCVCFPHGETQHLELLNPKDNGFQRLVVYIYKDINNNEMKVVIPDPGKQAIIPDIPISATDEVKTVTSENLPSHIHDALDKLKKNENTANIGENSIEFIPDTTKIVNSNIEHQITQEINQINNVYQENSPFNPLNNHLYTLAYLYQSNRLNPYQKQKLIEVFNRLKAQFNKKKSGLINIDNNNHSKPIKEAIELKKKLTFDQLFYQQIKVFRVNELSQGIHNLNTDILKSLIQKVLNENNINIDASGLITDENGASINLKNLELRSVVIGKPVTYQQLLNGDLILEDKVPYLEGILITLLYPPKILGVISLRDEYCAVVSDNATSSSPSDVNIDFLDAKPNTENSLSQSSSTSSDSKLNSDSSSISVLNIRPTETLLSSSLNSNKTFEDSSPLYNHWLHTLLHAVLNSNNEKILNASKDIQQRLILKSNNQKHQFIQGDHSWKNIYPADQHSKRLNNELDAYQNPRNPSLFKPSNGLPSENLSVLNQPKISHWSDNFRMSYSNPKEHLDPGNMQANLMTKYNKNPENFYPTFKDVQQTPYYKTDWNSPANANQPHFVTSHINYRPIYDSMEPGLVSNEGQASNLVGTYPIGFPNSGYYENKDYSYLPPIIVDQETYNNFQDNKQESVQPRRHPYKQSVDKNHNIINLSNRNTKQMGSKNPEANFENLVVKPLFLKTQATEVNNEDNNLIIHANKRQGLSLPGPGLSSVVKSLVNRFRSLLQPGDNNRSSGGQVDFDVSTKRPGEKDDERPDYRIIGGSAATGSGAPVSNKGRSGYI